MKNKIVIIISAILVISAIICVVLLLKDSTVEVDKVGYEIETETISATNTYDIPEVIAESKSWEEYTLSEYYSPDYNFHFTILDDWIKGDYMDDNIYVYIEYYPLTDETVYIDVYNSNRDLIMRFD